MPRVYVAGTPPTYLKEPYYGLVADTVMMLMLAKETFRTKIWSFCINGQDIITIGRNRRLSEHNRSDMNSINYNKELSQDPYIERTMVAVMQLVYDGSRLAIEYYYPTVKQYCVELADPRSVEEIGTILGKVKKYTDKDRKWWLRKKVMECPAQWG